MNTFPINPGDVDISSGLIKIPMVHIVARSVARSVVELLQKQNEWRAFTLPELSGQPFCHESLALVQMMLLELESKGFLVRQGGNYTVTEEFILWCTKQKKQ